MTHLAPPPKYRSIKSMNFSDIHVFINASKTFCSAESLSCLQQCQKFVVYGINDAQNYTCCKASQSGVWPSEFFGSNLTFPQSSSIFNTGSFLLNTAQWSGVLKNTIFTCLNCKILIWFKYKTDRPHVFYFIRWCYCCKVWKELKLTLVKQYIHSIDRSMDITAQRLHNQYLPPWGIL